MASIAYESAYRGADPAADQLQRKRLITAVSVAVVAHAIVLVVLAQPARFKLGIDRADPVMTRWFVKAWPSKPRRAKPLSPRCRRRPNDWAP